MSLTKSVKNESTSKSPFILSLKFKLGFIILTWKYTDVACVLAAPSRSTRWRHWATRWHLLSHPESNVYHACSLVQIITESLLEMCWHYWKIMAFVIKGGRLKDNNDFGEKLSEQQPIVFDWKQCDESLPMNEWMNIGGKEVELLQKHKSRSLTDTPAMSNAEKNTA